MIGYLYLNDLKQLKKATQSHEVAFLCFIKISFERFTHN